MTYENTRDSIHHSNYVADCLDKNIGGLDHD